MSPQPPISSLQSAPEPLLDTVESPAAGFITVLTPASTPKALDVTTEEHDGHGLRMREWTTQLLDADGKPTANNFSLFAWLCPCVVLSQLQIRVGLSSRFGASLLLNAALFVGRLAFLLAALCCFVRMWTRASCVGGFVVFLALFLACALLVAQRIALVRAEVRERLEIGGSPVDDRRVACLHSARAVRQMAVQLQCDRVKIGAPATLQAYQV